MSASTRRYGFAAGFPALTFLVALAAAGVGLARYASGNTFAVPEGVARAFAAVAILLVAVGVAAVVHALRRRDVSRVERGVLAVGALVVPAGGVAYFAIGPEGSKRVASRVARIFA